MTSHENKELHLYFVNKEAIKKDFIGVFLDLYHSVLLYNRLFNNLNTQ